MTTSFYSPESYCSVLKLETLQYLVSISEEFAVEKKKLGLILKAAHTSSLRPQTLEA
jgi:hypothetical protein